MNHKLLFVLLVLFLTACGTHSVRDDSPASELDAMEANARRDLQPRLLPNGKEYCAEDAKTEKQQDNCLGDLEDVAFKSNEDKARAMSGIETAVKRMKLMRNPCGFWKGLFNRSKCNVTTD